MRPDQSGGCGIAAGVEFVMPAPFLWRVYRAVLGHQQVEPTSYFEKSQLTWRLMRLLPEIIQKPIYAPLSQFLRHDDDMRKRLQLAERIADLFDQYQVYRADWLGAWESGEDVLIKANGQRAPLSTEDQWQAVLWRDLLQDVSQAHAGKTCLSRAGVHAEFLRQVQAWPHAHRPARLPRRVMVLGISALPQQSLEVLAAISRWCEVLMCVHNPCEFYWADIIPDRMLLRATHFRQSRRHGSATVIDDHNLHMQAHPLLAAWGKQGRDFIGMLDEHDRADARTAYLPRFAHIQKKIDLFFPHITDQPRLLNQLQDDIRALRPLAETRQTWPPVPAQDDSIQFHIAHSPQREVEILHDQLLAAFNADASLQPSDVLVMVPHIDTYAPHIQAVFGLLPSHDKRHIPFFIADQAQRQNNPLVHAIAQLLKLPQLRLGVSHVLDWLEIPALRKRFGISADQLPLLKRWIQGAQIRWGLDAKHRASFGLRPELAEPWSHNTWIFGIQRLLLGYATGATASAWNDIEPYDDIGGLEAAALGPLAQLIQQLLTTWQELSTPAKPDQWCLRLQGLLERFFKPESTSDEYTLQQLKSALEDWRKTCAQSGLDSAMPLTVVSDYWLDQLDTPQLNRRFLGGAVTFATLMPMRAIPFRQIALLGMNDGDFPRTRHPVNFDLMGRDYRPGDRSRREDDRYLFLEALLSARERLLISWVGRSVLDNSEKPPSVLVGQLRDHLAAGWVAAQQTEGGDADALLKALTTTHPLQPFSTAYFSEPHSTTKLFTYAHEWRPETSDAFHSTPHLAGSSLPALERTEPLRIKDLSDFLAKPVEAFFRQRLKVYFEPSEQAQWDHEPFDLNALDQWQLRDEMLAHIAQHMNIHTTAEQLQAYQKECVAQLRGRGQLPAGAFGDLAAESLTGPLQDLLKAYQTALAKWPILQPHEGEVRYQSTALALQIFDTLTGFRTNEQGQRGRIVLETSHLINDKNQYKRHRLIPHWVEHLVAHLCGTPVTTEIISPVGSVTFTELTEATAREHIDNLLHAWHEGMKRPLPLAAKTAFGLLMDVANVAAIYDGSHQQDGEVDRSIYLQRTWPDYAALSANGEFSALAHQLLGPLNEQIPQKRKAKSDSEGEPA
jgi:exodeoxyribonuclease V gamma subunit